MSVTATTSVMISATETLPSGDTLRVNIADAAAQLNASSTPPVTKQAGGPHALTAGAETLDLTAIANQAGGTVTFLGLKIQRVKITVTVATAMVYFSEGATNGYGLFGADTDAAFIGLLQGETAYLEFADTRDDVAAANKTIDVSSTDLDAAYTIWIAGG